MADKPSINLSLSALEAEVNKPEPFVFALSGSKRITFPDLFDMPAEDAEAFFDELQSSGQNDFHFLEKWLTKDDFETYKAAKLPLRVHAALVNKVMGYYQATLDTMGKPGEGSASAS